MAATPPIVALHGFTHTGASWEPVRAALAPGARLHALDVRGHGSRSADRPVDLPSVVEDVAGAVPGRFGLAGYSMGGRLALHVALAHPDRVLALTLVGASPGIADAGERAVRRADDERLAAGIERDGLEAFVRRWARTPVLADQPEAVRRAVDADRRRNTAAGLAAALRGLGAGALEPVWDRLGELPMPVTVIVGERDARYREIASRMARRLRRAAVLVVPRAGHAVHLEAPAAVAAALADPARRAGAPGARA